VLLTAAVWCWWFSWRGSLPFEDATMLFRYIDNVVAGHGVVWNVGEAPVDGATDLGFMFLLAAVRTFGVGAQTAALIVNSLAFLAVAGGVFVFARLRQIPPVPAVLASALFVLSPAATLIHAGFGAVFFGASKALVVIAMFRLTDQRTAHNAILLASAGVAAGPTRPEWVGPRAPLEDEP
jgi:arabinofuranosyltransferase